MIPGFLTTDLLRQGHQRAYYFGLGFIQIKMNERERYHFYAKELPAIVDTPHNRRYDFKSQILAGTFHNFIWVEDELGPWFEMTQENCKPPGTEGSMKIRPAIANFKRLIQFDHKTYHAGQSYFMDHNTLHTVQATECITFLERSAYRKDESDVAVPKGGSIVCPFSHKISDDDLWQIVDRMLKEHKPDDAVIL